MSRSVEQFCHDAFMGTMFLLVLPAIIGAIGWAALHAWGLVIHPAGAIVGIIVAWNILWWWVAR